MLTLGVMVIIIISQRMFYLMNETWRLSQNVLYVEQRLQAKRIKNLSDYNKIIFACIILTGVFREKIMNPSKKRHMVV